MCGARHAQRAHRRLGAARDEAQHLDVRHPRAHELRELDLEPGRDSEARPARHRLAQRVEHDGGRVAEHERAPREHVVEVLVAVDVPDARPFAALDDERLATNAAECAHRRADAAGNSSRARAISARERDVSRADATSVIARSSRSSCSSRAARAGAAAPAQPARSTTRSSDARKSTSSSIPSITRVDDRAGRERLRAVEQRDAIDVVGLPHRARLRLAVDDAVDHRRAPCARRTARIARR